MTASSPTRLSSVFGVASVALIEVAMAISLAALLVRDVGPEALPRLMGALLVGAAFAVAVLGLRSSLPGTISTVQDTPAVLLAAVTSALLAGVSPDAQAATLLVFVATSGFITGLIILVIGLARLGDAVRFLPTSVLDGFRLGTGWLLLVGGLEVAADSTLSSDLIGDVPGWSIGLALAVAAIFAGSERVALPPAALGAGILGVGVLFLSVTVSVSTLDDASDAGWLLGPLDSRPRWRPISDEIVDADWGAIAGQLPVLIAVAFISITSLLLNTSAIEAELDLDADVNRDLRSTGISNLITGAAGSSPTYVMFSRTMLAQRLGLRDRRAYAIVGLMMFGVFFAGASAVGYVPRFLAGGLLAGLGLQLAVRWFTLYRTSPRGDAALSLLVAVVVGAVGVLEGVGLGVVLAALIFVRRYSLLDPVRRVTFGTASLSRIDRDTAANAHLRDRAAATVVVELGGFLFFGSASRVARTLRGHLDDSVEHLVLDFAAVTGVDGSASSRLRQFVARAERNDVRVWFSGGPPAVGSATDRFPDLDHCIAAVEAVLLADVADRAELDDPLVEFLAAAPPMELEAGADLFVVGEAADSFVVVESGRLSVWLAGADGRPVRVRQVGPGALLGELGYATGTPRTARATADEPCVVRVVDRAFVERQGAGFEPDLNRLLLRRVADRLATTNQLIRQTSR